MEPDRGRDIRKKKYTGREREKEPTKKMVILTKLKEVKTDDPPPTILQKPKEIERTISSRYLRTSKTTKDSESPTQSYQLAPKGGSGNQGTSGNSPVQMKDAIKLLNEDTLTINDSLLDYLTDSNDFLVVGCIGLQGVGKSTIMSHLADPGSINIPELLVFKNNSKNSTDSSLHTTEGIQCYVTHQRVILLDTQPVLSMSVLSKYYSSEGAGLSIRSCHRDDPDYPSLENDVELLFLQYITFILTVCHVVVIVQDYFYDADLIRFIQTAEMLKPQANHTDDETNDYFPHCILVHTNSSQASFSHVQVRHIQDVYKAMFSHSQLVIQSGLGIANGVFMPSLSPELCGGDPINLFLLPEKRQGNQQVAYEVKEYEEIMDLLRSQIHGIPVVPLTHSPLSEKNWLHYAMKVWDEIRKSALIVEYGRLLPTSSSFKVDQ